MEYANIIYSVPLGTIFGTLDMLETAQQSLLLLRSPLGNDNRMLAFIGVGRKDEPKSFRHIYIASFCCGMKTPEN